MMMKRLQLFLYLLLLVPALVLAEKPSTDELIRQLQSGDSGDRAKAARELGERGEALGVPALIQATHDKEENVQMAVVHAIGKINTLDQIHAMSEAVKNTSGDAQQEAIDQMNHRFLNKQEGRADEALLKLERPTSTYPAVDTEATDALLQVLDDKNSTNRILAAAALGMMKVQSALPRLQYYLKSPNDDMTRICVRAVGNIGQKDQGAGLIPLLKHPNESIVVDTVRVLGYFRYQPALAELQHFLDYSNKKEYKRVALQAICRIGDPSSEPLVRKYFQDDDDLMRQYAIEGFGRLHLTQDTANLERTYLREKDKTEKLALSFSLFLLGRKAYLDNLVRALDEKPYEDLVRAYLVEIGDDAVDPLSGYLKPADRKFRIRLLQMFGEIGSEKSLVYLEPYLKDEDVNVAQAATDAVRDIKRKQEAEG